MFGRLRFSPLLLAVATATLLLAAIGATIATDQAQAQICNPVCLPPPEEEEAFEEEVDPGPLPTPAPRKLSVLVVHVGWGDGGRTTDSPLREGALPEYVNFINGFVNRFYEESAPPGAFPGWNAEAGGSYTISRPNVPTSCNDDAEHDFVTDVIQRAEQKLEAQGINYERYNLVTIVYERSLTCFVGRQASNRVLLSITDTTIHEFAHYLGIREHANTLECKDASGSVVTLSTTCKEVEYGDPYDVMGHLGRDKLSFNAIYAKQLGWLNGQYFDMRAPETGMRLIKPFIGSGFSGQRAIRLQDGPTTLWIEYRRPLGIDGIARSPLRLLPSRSGVFVRREVSGPGGPRAQLLDMTPEALNPLTFTSPTLEVGRTWANPLGEATISLIGTTSAGAVITIGNRRTATVPNVIGLDVNRAAAIIAGAGLWSQSFTPIVDVTCSFFGLVAAQEPFPGQKAIPGTEVRIQVGEHDPNPETPCQ
jgi:hypothetical protein